MQQAAAVGGAVADGPEWPGHVLRREDTETACQNEGAGTQSVVAAALGGGGDAPGGGGNAPGGSEDAPGVGEKHVWGLTEAW